MKRNKFNFENPTFSQQSDQQFNLPSQQMIGQYSKEYNYIMKQTENFLKQCKHSLQKFISLNQFGIGLNLHRILLNFNSLQSKIIKKQDDKQQKIKIKQKYQLSFNKLMQRMGDLIADLHKFQYGFKQEYFGHMFSSSPYNSQSSSPPKKNLFQQQTRFKMEDFFRSQSSLSRSNSGKFSFNNYQQSPEQSKSKNPQTQQQKQKVEIQLRQILHKKLSPFKQTFQRVTKEQYTTNQNIDKINNKIDLMISKMSSNKNKEIKIVQVFKKNRIQSKTDQNFNVSSFFQRKKQLKNKKQDFIFKQLKGYKQKKSDENQMQTTIRNQYKLQSFKQPSGSHLFNESPNSKLIKN